MAQLQLASQSKPWKANLLFVAFADCKHQATPTAHIRLGEVNLARVALRKSDLEGGPGVELLALCQTITEDGSLSDAEVADLRRWLQDNQTADLPAIAILVSLVETIIRDGKVTKAERDELHRTLERVLPPELRAVAVSRRRIATAEAREQAKAEKAAEKERKAAEALRDSPIDGANFMGSRFKIRGARPGDPSICSCR